MALPPLNIKYLYDPTGVSKDNYVSNERHTLPPINNRMIVPRNGAFYSASMVVRSGDRLLVKDKDYEFAALYQRATHKSGQQVNVMIHVKNLDITGDIYLSYQVVGGEFVGIFEAIQEYVNVLLIDPRKTLWDNVLDKPELYAPKEHFHEINDIYGLNALVTKLEEIRNVLLRMRSKELRNVYSKILRVQQTVDTTVKLVNTSLSGQTKILSNTTGELDKIKARLAKVEQDVVNKATGNSTDVSAVLRGIRESLATVDTLITNLTNDKADKTEVEQKYQDLLDQFKLYFKDGKLINKYVRISDVEDNLLRNINSGLYMKDTCSTITYSKQAGIYTIRFYVDPTSGNDNNNGSLANPFRTIARAIQERKLHESIYTEILLQPNTVNLVEANHVNIIRHGVVRIRCITSYVTDENKPVIKFTDGQPSVENSITTNHCFYLHNATLRFSNVKLQLSTSFRQIRARGMYWEYPAICGGTPFINQYSTLCLDRGTTLDMGDDGQMSLWDIPDTGTNYLYIHPSVLNTAFTGRGRIFNRLNSNVQIFLSEGNDTNLNESTGKFVEGSPSFYIPKPVVASYELSDVAIDNIRTYIPQLKRTEYGILGGVVTNINPNQIDKLGTFKTNDELSTEIGSILTSMSVGQGLLFAAKLSNCVPQQLVV